MRKTYIFFAGLLVLLGMLSGCSFFYDGDNPLSGKNTDERIIMALEKAYPEHDFKTVKEYGKHGGKYYAVCADENGLEFRVRNIMYDNAYHFGCHDEYIQELMEQQSFVEKAAEIAEGRGYRIEYDKDNGYVKLEVDASGHDVDASDVAECIKDIMASVNVPEVHIGDEGFSTGEVNYFTVGTTREVFYHFTAEDGYRLAGDLVRFDNKDASIEELLPDIQAELDRAYENLEARRSMEDGSGESQ